MKIVLIGSGNVATHLGKAFHKAGHRILQVYGRTEKSASRLAKYLKAESINDLQKLHPKADVYFIALKDEAIAEIISFIPNKEAIVLHT
ncbi:MAG TPA: NAD(P)-binding domain-containing protein, partial [Bacteroidia bacterium]|nr:NAD(P)-binding domain-containing protein [Bacteroidia bacterium]